MQASWRHDADKLTFIICQPLQKTIGSGENIAKDACSNVNCDADAAMLGDVNMFLTFNEDDQDDEDAESQSTPTDGTHHPPEVVGELELMIAERKNQKHGYGRAALLSFLLYVLRNEDTIVRGFLESKGYAPSREMSQRLDFFCVKIGADNVGSIRLFESLGFKKLKEEPNVFGELELRRMFDGNAHGIEETMELMRKYDVGQSVEMPYQRWWGPLAWEYFQSIRRVQTKTACWLIA